MRKSGRFFRPFGICGLVLFAAVCVLTGCETEDPNQGFYNEVIIGAIINARTEATRCGPPQNPAQEIEVNTEYVFQGFVCLAVTTSGPAEIKISSSGNEGALIIVYDKTGIESDRSSEHTGSNVALNISEAQEDLRLLCSAGQNIDYILEVIE